jgi:hypothetical protein
MKKVSSAAAIAALISVGATMPAYASWTNIGRVDFAYGVDKNTAYGNFGGPATALQLTARDSDVDCRFVRATFGNGNTANVFQGKLPQGRGVRIDLPGDKRNVTKLAFECRSFVRSGAHVDIDADVGAYRQLWMRNPFWTKFWAAVLHPQHPVLTQTGFQSEPNASWGPWIATPLSPDGAAIR